MIEIKGGIRCGRAEVLQMLRGQEWDTDLQAGGLRTKAVSHIKWLTEKNNFQQTLEDERDFGEDGVRRFAANHLGCI